MGVSDGYEMNEKKEKDVKEVSLRQKDDANVFGHQVRC